MRYILLFVILTVYWVRHQKEDIKYCTTSTE